MNEEAKAEEYQRPVNTCVCNVNYSYELSEVYVSLYVDILQLGLFYARDYKC